MVAISEKIEKISQKKSNLAEVEKKLKYIARERDKRKRIKKSVEIGKIACKAEIDSIDYKTLLGAFLEIAERSKDAKAVQLWDRLSSEHEMQKNDGDTKLSIQFSSDVDSNLKKKLKELNFTWNKFRREFYGYADKKTLANLLGGLNYKIEELE